MKNFILMIGATSKWVFLKKYIRCQENTRGGCFILRVLYGCDIPKNTKIGKNVFFGHRGLGTVINEGSVIGNNVSIQHHVTLARGKNGCPVIHDNVTIGAYAFIMGNVNIPENTIIGAGTMILHDINESGTYINKHELVKI